MKTKLKLPNIFQVKRKKLRANASRRSMRAATTADYDDLSEPNMKLSRALLIVLVLHVVAVSGIIAFNAIKTRQGPPPPAPVAESMPAGTASTTTTDISGPQVQLKEMPREEIRPAHAVKASAKTEHVAPAPSSRDSGKTYVVAKGDNPVGIAKKLKVSYDELLGLNHITDPKKLQIGQKLLVPKPPKAKKADE